MRLIASICCLLLAACAAIPSPAARRDHADALAAAKGWVAAVLPAGDFDLVAYLPPLPVAAEEFDGHLEGDGLAWISSSQLSDDPSPRDPLALRLALSQPDGAAAYLARPCQYGAAAIWGCASRYWAEARFAPEVVAATSAAIDALKTRFRARRLILVGYSGGGGLAALVAARRDDVNELVTVAGNLDHAAWAMLHRLEPLAASLNPADGVGRLVDVPQLHLVGEDDRNITPALVNAFADRFPAAVRPRVDVVPGFDHRCCWATHWPALWLRRAD
ncbi:alpha/beta hydrolase [Thauera humireducens]|uniref:alpha/beta hydrolase n=1 Tax=Thauera humireducens TaxID=1134435 RepID=UPI00311E9DA1